MKQIRGMRLRAAVAMTVALAVHLLLVAILASPPSPRLLEAKPEPLFELVALPEVEPRATPLVKSVPALPVSSLPVAPDPSALAPLEQMPVPVALSAEVSRQVVEEESMAVEPLPVVVTAVPAAPDVPEYTAPDLAAAYRDNPAPPYPLVAQRRGLEGVVVVAVSLDVKGRPQQVAVKVSSGHGILDQAALQSVRKWQFVPAQRGGQPVMAEVEVPLRFALR